MPTFKAAKFILNSRDDMIKNVISELTILFLLASATPCLFARGNADVETRQVQNLNSWQEEFDINNKKGKYNVIVTAKDMGGNQTVEGPFNIWIDSKSDLPITGITNPVNGLRVPGNLNIVGTCVDDDAVDYVEIVIDDDKDNVVRATGKEFWSYFLDTSSMSEGLHKIEVYGVDVNGLRGNSVTTKWYLDRQQPTSIVNNVGLGTIVSGSVALEGIVSDGNGIEYLEYSIDSGMNFNPLKLSSKKKSTDSKFKLKIDTKKLPDGPAVVWFRARDNQGSMGFYSFLFFVDNTKPEVKIVYPAEKEIQNGAFAAAGYAKDIIGIKSLSWEYNGERGTFDLMPGNPYWVKEFANGKSLRSGKLVITAEDTAGNITKAERNIQIQDAGDRPAVDIQWPVAGSSIGSLSDTYIRGIAHDDDGVKEVRVLLDGIEIAHEETHGPFSVPLTMGWELPYGKHKVSVLAVDVYGMEGNLSTVEFTSSGGNTAFNFLEVKGGTHPTELQYGSVINPEQGGAISLEAVCAAGIKSAYYTVAKGDANGERTDCEVKAGAQRILYSVPVETLPWGVVNITFYVEDAIGRTSSYSTCLFVENLTKAFGKVTGAKDSESDGSLSAKIASIGDTEFVNGMRVQVPASAKDTPLNMSIQIDSQEAAVVTYKITGQNYTGFDDVIEGKALVTRADKASTAQEALINLSGVPARVNTIEIKVQAGKDRSVELSGCFSAVRSRDADQIEDEARVYWICDNECERKDDNSFVVKGQHMAAYANGTAPYTVAVQGGGAGLNAEVIGNIIYIEAKQGSVYKNVTLRVTDAAGKRLEAKAINIIADAEGPVLEMKSPAADCWIKDALTITGSASDAIGLDAIKYSIDAGESWIDIPFKTGASSAQINASVPVNSREEGLITVDVKAVSASGKESVWHGCAVRDVTPPVVTTVVPVAGDTVNGMNTFGFIAKDDGGVVKAEYVNNGPRGSQIRNEIGNVPRVATVVGTPEQPLNVSMSFDFTDVAGNVTSVGQFEFNIDSQSDLPVVQIHLPEEDAVITKDFTVSGIVLDDDGPCRIRYKIDNGAWISVPEGGYSFSLDIPLITLTDNEHTITVRAVDINGVEGEEVVRKIRVSLEEPKGEMKLPSIDTTQKEIVTLEGVASDKNGIQKVEVSLDNGNSYNAVEGTENWKYVFDSRIFPDGTHVVFVKSTDNYGVEGIYSTLINLDNTKPELTLELPLDDSKTSGHVFFSGFTLDNIGLTSLYITVTSLQGKRVPAELAKKELVPDRVITTEIDLSALEDGDYNIELSGKDAAGNVTSVSRNIHLDKRVAAASVNIYYPLNGEHKCGAFNISGKVESEREVEKVMLYVDGKVAATQEVPSTNFFQFNILPALYEDGKHQYMVQAVIKGGAAVASITQSFDYSAYGPWIKIDNFGFGDFAYDRPFIRGSAGYSITEEEIASAKTKGATKDQKLALASKDISKIEISLDNGKTFTKIAKGENWKYRVENEDIAEGYHFLLVRAVMKNGEIAIDRLIVQVDQSAPYVRLISPGIGGHYNQTLNFSGLASDAVGLTSVELALRKGDKAGYEVPSFIQGLYLDASFWGATFFSVGMGLTFFNDNVRLPAQWGQFTQEQRNIFDQSKMRYGGDNILGFKIIANIANLPFMYFFGRDWEPLSANFAIGANFSLFNITASGKPQMLSSVIGQIEFPRLHFKKMKMLRTISLYTEGQLWFIPTDVQGANSGNIKNVVFQFSEGIRISIF